MTYLYPSYGESLDFPTDFDDRLDIVLSIINTESKSAIHGFCLDNIPKTKAEIRNIAKDYMTNTSSLPDPSTFGEYCNFFFEKGSVSKSNIYSKPKKQPKNKFKLSEEGYKYIKPLSQFSLKYAVDNNLSMQDIFGQTSSKGSGSSPFYTGIILLELNQKDNISIHDIKNNVKVYTINISKHLKRLENCGFVDYESVFSETSNWSEQDIKAKYIPCEIQSNVILTDKGRQFIEEYLKPVYQFISDSDYDIVNDTIKDIDPYAYISKGFELYKKASPRSKAESCETIQNKILEILKNGEVRKKDIDSILEKKDTSKYLKPLFENGILNKRKSGLAVFYSIL
ncbi:MAG: hypothetical protein K0B02_01715 [DPANN group archaeon]|nr:hypothetical protein [DPANN group archaeon]